MTYKDLSPSVKHAIKEELFDHLNESLIPFMYDTLVKHFEANNLNPTYDDIFEIGRRFALDYVEIIYEEFEIEKVV